MKYKKETIINFIKIVLLLAMMTNGFFLTYAWIWFAFGFPKTNWAMWILYAISVLTEYGYCRWLKE